MRDVRRSPLLPRALLVVGSVGAGIIDRVGRNQPIEDAKVALEAQLKESTEHSSASTRARLESRVTALACG
jgi:hypothetical protein